MRVGIVVKVNVREPSSPASSPAYWNVNVSLGLWASFSTMWSSVQQCCGEMYPRLEAPQSPPIQHNCSRIQVATIQSQLFTQNFSQPHSWWLHFDWRITLLKVNTKIIKNIVTLVSKLLENFLSCICLTWESRVVKYHTQTVGSSKFFDSSI